MLVCVQHCQTAKGHRTRVRPCAHHVLNYRHIVFPEMSGSHYVAPTAINNTNGLDQLCARS
jgi:hypothetical protein